MKSIRDYLDLLNEDQLNELADAPYALEKELRPSGTTMYKFRTDKNMEYVICFTPEGYNRFYLEFALESRTSDGDYEPYSINNGDAFRVFATVKSALVDFMKTQPNLIEFDSNEDSRSKLYKRMMSYLEKYYPDYDFKVQDKYSWKTSFFILKKDQV